MHTQRRERAGWQDTLRAMHGIWRMLDASLNRSREAARVVEDLTRFTLDDAMLSGRAKALRHGIGHLEMEIAQQDGAAAARRGSRDTPGDVGREIEGALEGQRSDAKGLAAANFRRLAEALRSAEECLKALLADQPQLWQCAERLRYDTYTLQSATELSLSRGAAAQWGVCLLLTRSLCQLPWREVLSQAVSAGVDCVQVREKTADSAELLRHIREVRQISPTVPVIVNDRLDLALAAQAAGVHLGQTDMPITAARRMAPPGFLIGATCHSTAEAAAARDDGADYCGLGPMFPTTTKPNLPLSGPALLREFLAAHPSMPHLAIGGITPASAAGLAENGCRGVAVSAAVCGSAEPGVVVGALRAAMRVAVA